MVKIARIILSGIMGGALGFSIVDAGLKGDWAIVGLSIGLLAGIFYIVLWGFAFHYND